jgi:DNA polymerase III subunit chi
MKKTDIIFLPITTNQQKIQSIFDTIQKHFEKGESTLIIAPSKQAMDYLDELLWKFAKDSFLPHIQSQHPCSDKIVITSLCHNLNGSRILFNLCPEACPIANEFDTIYELLDQTQPEKEKQAQHRYQTYSQQGYNVSARLG